MFTGIIEEIGFIEGIETRRTGALVRVRCKTVLEGTEAGASISVNGVCLTAESFRDSVFTATASPETIQRSNLSSLKTGSPVNLERALPAGGRLGGHIVQGHVDGTGELISVDPLGDDNWWLTLRAPGDLERYLVSKGSVALDGISLTIASIESNVLSATVVPHTYQNTTLKSRKPGDRLNIEIDILAKYVEKFLSARETSGLTIEKLREMGY
ncbi:MAG: riboflavin synthase [Bryobacteraceae bacterium]